MLDMIGPAEQNGTKLMIAYACTLTKPICRPSSWCNPENLAEPRTFQFNVHHGR